MDNERTTRRVDPQVPVGHGRPWNAERIGEVVGWNAMLAFIVAVPATGVWVNAGGHDYARVCAIALCLVASAALSLGKPRDRWTRTGVRATGWLALLALASTLQAPDLRMATREGTVAIGLAGLANFVARQTQATGMTPLLAAVAVAGAAYAGIVGIGLAATLAVGDTLRPFDLLIGYDSGRFFNHVQTSMLPLLSLATLHPFRDRRLNRLAFFGLAAGLALLALSEGRATGLALVVAAVAGTALFPHTAWPVLRKVAMASGCAALIYLVCFVALPRALGMSVGVLHVGGVGDTGSAQSRLILWHIALEGIRRAPWFGIGPMHFSHTWNEDAAHPHNVYLQVAEEWGVPMLILLLGIALPAVRALYRAVRAHLGDETDRRCGLGLFVTVIAIGVDGMLSGNFVMPVSQVWIAVVAGTAIGWVRRNAPPPATRSKASRLEVVFGRVLGVVPLAAMLWLTASVLPELGTHLLDQRAPGATFDAGAPRFWSNGWF